VAYDKLAGLYGQATAMQPPRDILGRGPVFRNASTDG